MRFLLALNSLVLFAVSAAAQDHKSWTMPGGESVTGTIEDNFGVVFTAEINAPIEGEYTFKVSSDDGSRLLVDGKAVVTLDGVHALGR
ncbi:MAG: hypothetical protein ACI8UO_005911 [Verrucomicrobiales bacterium]|jgi:hypothetical protein